MNVRVIGFASPRNIVAAAAIGAEPPAICAAIITAAETAFQQDVDLYSEQQKRITAALEFQAQCLPPNNAGSPPNVTFHLHPTWEIAYNHFHNRKGLELPKMATVIPCNRPTGVNHHMAWETLTHADLGSVGLSTAPVRR